MEKLLKAKKGTPEYEEWLRKYREKRGKKAEGESASGEKAKSVLEKKENDSKAKNDVVELYYDNGQPKSRRNYKNGKFDGLREDWYKNGKARISQSRLTKPMDRRDCLSDARKLPSNLWVKPHHTYTRSRYAYNVMLLSSAGS